MSQDLFAAFGGPSSNTRKGHGNLTAGQSFSFFDDINNPSNTPPTKGNNIQQFPLQAAKPSAFRDDPEVQENDDDWGDFEGVSGQAPAPSAAPIASQFSRWLDDDDEPGASSTQTGFGPSSNALGGPFGVLGPKLQAQTFQSPSISKPTPAPRDPNVLFDAEVDEPEPEDDDDDDDFGDFEGPNDEKSQPAEAPDFLGLDSTTSPVQAPAIKQGWKPAHQATSSLLDLDSLDLGGTSSSNWGPPVQSGQQIQHRPVSFGATATKTEPPSRNIPTQARNDLTTNRTPKPTSTKTKKPKSPIQPQEEEPWDDFGAWEQDQGPSQQDVSSTKITIPKPASPIQPSFSSTESPPTNIPPPAVLLSMFPALFNTSETDFFRPTFAESITVRHTIYSDQATITYLKGLVALATVCARVIAGRKHRWKRDTFLSQSMRIGPAAAGGVSGLKLTSVDKGETAKEDREVADVLRAWQSVIGRLKAAVTEVKKVAGVDVGNVPELREVMPVKAVKEVEGGIRGFKQCGLCGLKREERIGKVDFVVEDSFGEWWIEGANMHRACRNFWEEHEGSLRQR